MINEAMFDDFLGESSLIDGRCIPKEGAAIGEPAEAMELGSLVRRVCADVPVFEIVQPRVEIAIDERAAALRDNPYFVFLGHNHGAYYFRSKRSGELMVMVDDDKWILELAPLAFWESWSSTGEFQRAIIVDALIQLSQRIGQRRLADPDRPATTKL